MMVSPSASVRAVAPSLRAEGELSFLAFNAPLVAAPAIAAAFPSEPLVSWTSNDLTIVGVGIARELRGSGADRWTAVIDGARAVANEASHAPAATPLLRNVVIDGAPASLDALGFARPRFIGGAAFAPGAADRAPWQGFGDAWFVLPRWTYVSNGVRAMFVLAAEPHDVAKGTWQLELERLRAATSTATTSAQAPVVELQPARPVEWRTQVLDITDAIARGAHSKVVAARTCTVALAGNVDAAALLAALDARHADCVRVIVRPPNAGALVAATPERLVRRDGRAVHCDALAGTINIDADDARARLLASTKDRREHELVVTAIRTALEAAGATIETQIDEPGVRALRHVLHLHTPFRATLREPRHVLELVARLHPTPAVGGTPTQTAIDWIAAHEPVARGWYASPVGWFDFDGNGELAVAIRSGVLVENRAHLWAGAGIVAGSDPDRELAETDAKFRAMLGALGIDATNGGNR
jgi:menaquinone-specific isochorismate synthase